jgi:hypothetical protein
MSPGDEAQATSPLLILIALVLALLLAILEADLHTQLLRLIADPFSSDPVFRIR